LRLGDLGPNIGSAPPAPHRWHAAAVNGLRRGDLRAVFRAAWDRRGGWCSGSRPA